MKKILIASMALIPNIAVAHPGHTEMMAGHAHSYVELALYGLAFGAVALIVLAVLRFKSNG